MKTNDCIIDVQKDILSLLGTQHQILSEGISGSYKVSIVNRISIPPRTEVVTQGKICATGDGKLPARAAIIEPVEKFLHDWSSGCLATAYDIKKLLLCNNGVSSRDRWRGIY